MNGTGSDRLVHVAAYLRQGWAVVPLHHIRDGWCTCGRDAIEPTHTGHQGGKHPIEQGWTRTPIMDAAAAAAVWSANPGANVGLATGRRSGFWVLDVDPDNGGDIRLGELEATHGSLPQTYRVQTGSGGSHWYWSMPRSTDFEPTNSRGRLPAGLDVRGTGGQVVAPPSVSGKGLYRALSAIDLLQPAPDWLLDMIRPLPYASTFATGFADSDLGANHANRGGRYAAAAVASLGAELGRASEGTRNETAFRVACRLHELLNAGWSGLSADRVLEAYLAGAQDAHYSAGSAFTEAEALEVWTKAARHVAGRAATLPPDTMSGEFFPWGTSVIAGEPPPFSQPGEATDTQMEPLDPVDIMIAGMLTPAQLRVQPNPVPLVLGLLDMDTSAWLIGKPGTYKSFVALSLGATVAAGREWLGRPTRRGPVVYVVGEGLLDLKLRQAAWENVYGPMIDIWFLPRPVQADERRAAGEWSVLVEACRRLGAVMVIIDTQARASIGLKENDNSDMMVYVSQAARIQRATGACVLTVHHIGRTGTDARGASAIDGAQDTELRLERLAERRVTLWTDKQKAQSDQGAGLPLGLLSVPGGTDPETGRDLSSLVLVPAAALPMPPPDKDWLDNLPERQGQVIGIVLDHFPGVGGTKAEISAVMRERFGPVPKGSYARAWDALVKSQILIRVDGSQRYLLASMAP